MQVIESKRVAFSSLLNETVNEKVGNIKACKEKVDVAYKTLLRFQTMSEECKLDNTMELAHVNQVLGKILNKLECVDPTTPFETNWSLKVQPSSVIAAVNQFISLDCQAAPNAIHVVLHGDLPVSIPSGSPTSPSKSEHPSLRAKIIIDTLRQSTKTDAYLNDKKLVDADIGHIAKVLSTVPNINSLNLYSMMFVTC